MLGGIMGIGVIVSALVVVVAAVVIFGVDVGVDAILYLGLSVHYPHRIMYARRLVESMSNRRPLFGKIGSMP